MCDSLRFFFDERVLTNCNAECILYSDTGCPEGFGRRKIKMKNVTEMAISKVKTSAKKLPVGRHEVDSVVRLVGEVVVSEDQMIAPTASLMSVEFLLLTLRAAGVTREAAMKAIGSVAGDYLVDWTGSDADKKAAKKARKAAVTEFDPDGKGRVVFDEFKAGLPRIPRSGAVKFEGTVEEVALTDGVLVEVVDAS